jgi:hypothetical protein
MGFVVEKENILGNNKAFVEVEYADIYGIEIQNFDSATLENVRIRMQYLLSFHSMHSKFVDYFLP